MSLLDRMKEAESNPPKPKPGDLILEQFKGGAPEYWGEVTDVHIYSNRVTGQGTEYFLVIADTNKDEVEGKLLQEWYINKKGEARVNPRRIVWIAKSVIGELKSEV